MTSPKWPYFLPVPPNCTPDPCDDPCQNWWSQSDHLAYTGPNLPCTVIETCDTLSVVIQKIEEAICQLMITTTTTTTIDITTSTTTTSTTTIISSTTTTSTSSTTTTTTTTIIYDCQLEGNVTQVIIQ